MWDFMILFPVIFSSATKFHKPSGNVKVLFADVEYAYIFNCQYIYSTNQNSSIGEFSAHFICYYYSIQLIN